MNTLSGRVPIGFYTILNVYDCVIRCIKCQGLGHTVESCNKRVSVCGHCGGIITQGGALSRTSLNVQTNCSVSTVIPLRSSEINVVKVMEQLMLNVPSI